MAATWRVREEPSQDRWRARSGGEGCWAVGAGGGPKLLARMQEALRCRHGITVGDGKGAPERLTMLLESLKKPLQDHLRKVKTVHEKDRADGWGHVQLPDALDRQYPNVPTEWRGQWVFPQENRWKDAKTRVEGRHPVDESIPQKAFKPAVDKASFAKRATCHTLCYSFAPHLLENGYDMRTVQELLGHNDVRPRMIYTHVLNRGGRGVKSPVDSL